MRVRDRSVSVESILYYCEKEITEHHLVFVHLSASQSTAKSTRSKAVRSWLRLKKKTPRTATFTQTAIKT